MNRKGWFTTVVGVLLAASVAPAGRFSGRASSPTVNRIRVVVLGDSITKGVREGVRREETFAALVERALRAENVEIEVVNLGVGGERADQAVQRLEAVHRLAPSIVAVMYGTNDSYVDQGASRSRIDLETYRNRLTEILEDLRAHKVQPILMTEPRWADDAPRNGLGENPNVRLEPYMTVCRDLAKRGGLPLVDHYSHWTKARANGLNLAEWTTDGCHPNPEGHRQLARALLDVLRDEIMRLPRTPS